MSLKNTPGHREAALTLIGLSVVIWSNCNDSDKAAIALACTVTIATAATIAGKNIITSASDIVKKTYQTLTAPKHLFWTEQTQDLGSETQLAESHQLKL